MKKRMIFPQNDEDSDDSVFHWRKRCDEAVDKWVRLDSLLTKVIRENDMLKRENSILRSELKERLVSEWIVNYEMSEEETEKAAEQYIIQMVAHNEGAE
jgi:regulator of replication initiation timing